MDALELFVEVMRTRNFTDAARSRGWAPSSVSRSIAALEKNLGFRLFQRSTRKLEPTEAAQVFFERITPLLQELQAAKLAAADTQSQPKGTLRVTAAVVYGEMYVVPLLPEFARLYPEVSIELVLSDAYIDLIEERIDIALRLGTLKASSHIARRLTDMVYYVCASPAYLARHGTPETPREIQDHNCLIFPRSGHNDYWRFKSRSGHTADIPVHGRCLITHSQSIRRCTVDGMGLSLLPDWLVGHDIQSGRLVRLFGDFDITPTDYEGAVWLLYPSRNYLPLKTKLFMEFVISRIQNGLYQKGS